MLFRTFRPIPANYIIQRYIYENLGDLSTIFSSKRSNVFRDRSGKIWERWEKREEKRGEKARHRLKIPFAFSLPFPLSPGSALSARVQHLPSRKKKKKKKRQTPFSVEKEGRRKASFSGKERFPSPPRGERLATRRPNAEREVATRRQREKERERTPAPLRGLAAAVAAVSYLGLRGAPLYRRTATLGSLPLHPLLVFRATPIYPPFYHSCCTLCVQQPRPR